MPLQLLFELLVLRFNARLLRRNIVSARIHLNGLALQESTDVFILEAVFLTSMGGIGSGINATIKANFLRFLLNSQIFLQLVNIIQFPHVGNNTNRAAVLSKAGGRGEKETEQEREERRHLSSQILAKLPC